MSNGLKLEQLRILPPMVIARSGSSPTPIEAYDVCIPVDGSNKPTDDCGLHACCLQTYVRLLARRPDFFGGVNAARPA